MAINLVKIGLRESPAQTNLHPSVSASSNLGYNDMNYLERPERMQRSRWLRYTVIGVIAAVWIAIAVMAAIWWMNRMRASSEPLDPQYQRMYVKVVAQRYWQTSDLARAQRDLISWREQDLAQLLAAMQGETKDPETRKQLAVLAAALRLPQPETPAIYSFFSREIILMALGFALLPLLVAVGIVAAPYLKTWTSPIDELPVEEAAEKLEELLPDLPIEEQMTAPPEEKKEEEKKDAEEAPKEEEEEKADELGDLASLFQEEDTSLSALEQFTKGMAEVDIDDLIKSSKESLRQLLGLNSATFRRS